MPLISVIVPAYNVRNYIEKSIQSILKQTLTDFELLLIDDGATDGTSEICDRIGLYDERIRVYHKSNGGLSDARNYGLSMATGKYITFIDSDDYVASNYLEVLYRPFLLDSTISISMVSTQELLENQIPREYYEYPMKIVSKEEAMSRMLLRAGFSHCGVGKLYERMLWADYEFPIGRLYEDYLTTYYVFSEAEHIALCECALYYYIQRSGSIMHYTCSKRTLSLLDVADEVTVFLCENYPSLKDEAMDLQVASYLKCYQKILNLGKDSFIEEQKRIMGLVRGKAVEMLKSNKVSIKDKGKVILAMMGKSIFSKVYNWTDGSIRVEK